MNTTLGENALSKRIWKTINEGEKTTGIFKTNNFSSFRRGGSKRFQKNGDDILTSYIYTIIRARGFFFRYIRTHTFVVIAVVKFPFVKHERVHLNARIRGICFNNVLYKTYLSTRIYIRTYIFLLFLFFIALLTWFSRTRPTRDAHYRLAGTTRAADVHTRRSPLSGKLKHNFHRGRRFPRAGPHIRRFSSIRFRLLGRLLLL